MGDINTQMSAADMAHAKRQANEVNQKIKAENGKIPGGLGRDSFLKLLVTEMTHQDPTNPMKDREFISQMAQFSSLEQMTNIHNGIEKLNNRSQFGDAYGLLGKEVEAFIPETGTSLRGEVSRIVFAKDGMKLLVQGREISMENIHAVYPPKKEVPAGNAGQQVQQVQQVQQPAASTQQETMQPAAPRQKQEIIGRYLQNLSNAKNNTVKDVSINNDTIKKTMVAPEGAGK